MAFGVSHQTVLRLKQLVWGRRGEPYPISGHVLRYAPGTRPVRTRYATSPNPAVRYDAMQARLFAEGLNEGDTAIDIGAHAGQYALIMAARCGPSGHVAAFEPDPHARRKLERNIALNPGVKAPVVEALAVSDAPGEAVLYSRGGDSQSSLARSGIGEAAAERAERFTVPLVTLDGYIADRRLAAPRWVKIDTEGAEIRILKGAPQLLAGPSNILCELHPYAWAEFGNSFEELQAAVSGAGRRIRYIDETAEMKAADVRYGTVLLERPS
jgi:FkbM family methyltransferase